MPVTHDLEAVKQVKARHEAELMSKKNVVGVGVGYRERQGMATHEVSIIVMVTKKLPPQALSSEDLIPAYVEGIPTDVREVGTVKAM